MNEYGMPSVCNRSNLESSTSRTQMQKPLVIDAQICDRMNGIPRKNCGRWSVMVGQIADRRGQEKVPRR